MKYKKVGIAGWSWCDVRVLVCEGKVCVCVDI